MIGETIAHYHIVEKLGEGGMGVVYKARDTRLDRFVALKVLPPERVADPERKRRFVQEAKAASALAHPNIITIHDIASDGGRDFIVMEYVAGTPLDQVIGPAPQPLETTLSYGVQIADALAKAHAAGIVHRDLKPANVMVTADGLLKLLDFGLAKLLRPDSVAGVTRTITEPHTVTGTLPYMAPEQLRGETVDPRTDIWAVGVLLYESATGRRPFTASAEMALASDIQTKAPPPPRQLDASIPLPLEQIVLKCLEKDPGRRYQSARELRADLDLLRGPAAAKPGRGARGVRWWAARAAIAVAAAAVVGTALLWRTPEPPPEALTITPATSFVGMEWGATFSPDASLLAYSHNRYGHMDVFVLPVGGGGDPVRLTTDPTDEVTPRWSPDGGTLAFLSDHGNGASVYLIPARGGEERRLVDTHLPWLEEAGWVLRALGASPWSADSSQLLFSRFLPAGEIAIWKVDVRTGAQTQITRPAPGIHDLYASWSPDGARIAFSRDERGQQSLWVSGTQGADPEVLLSDANQNGAPAWSADGRRVIFVSDRSGPRSLWEVDVSSRRVRQLTSGRGYATLPVVSRDGSVAYTEYTHQVDLYWGRVDQPAEKHQRLTSHTHSNFGGRISPDGRRVAYHSDRTGNWDLWLLDRETGAERNLTNHPATDIMGDWSPDGRQIVFLSGREGGLHVWGLDVDSGHVRRISEKAQVPGVNDQFSGPRWSPDGSAIGFVAVGETEQALWVVDPQGRNERAVLPAVSGFDWYRGSRIVVYTRKAGDTSDTLETRVANLETRTEALLLRGPTAELAVSRDGRSLACVRSASHFDMQLQLLRLVPPARPGDLPRAAGQPEPLTHGEAAYHVHNGGWSPDGRAILYTRDSDNGDVFILQRR